MQKDTKFTVVKGNRRNNNKPKIPDDVIIQRNLCKKHKYSYNISVDGNIKNNSTLYVSTIVAHSHQIEAVFNDAIERAKKMPEIFGDDFECDVKVNVVKNYAGEYIGFAFVDVSNPKFYYAILGYNLNGTERAEYVDDPNWIKPTITKEPKIILKKSALDLLNDEWNESEEEIKPPKIKKEIPPLLSLGEYEYDEQQKNHLQTEVVSGGFTISAAYITPGIKEEYDDCSLYISEVPAIDHDFLYALFARYARTSSSLESDKVFYPKINIRQSNKEEDSTKTGIFAIVEYAHPSDAAFALLMIKKVRACYMGKDISMVVRYAFKNKTSKKI